MLCHALSSYAVPVHATVCQAVLHNASSPVQVLLVEANGVVVIVQ